MRRILFITGIVTTLLSLCLQGITQDKLPAFPGAEGFGAYTTGGRGGDVYIVSNLNDDGPGSLREAVEASGPRTIVFAISGTIELQSTLRINNGDLTIAGQTAPGGGICLKNYNLSLGADNIIIRYLRVRLGVDKHWQNDATNGRGNNVIIDHCSISWGVDETASHYTSVNFTMQWCIISEALYNSFHSQGPHGMGGIWGGHGASFHHNLMAHNHNRNPRFSGSRYSGEPHLELVDHRNNVIYNWGTSSCYGAEGGRYNIVNNYYKSGPATASSTEKRIIAPRVDDGANSQPEGTWGSFYVAGNYVAGYPNVTEDNWLGVEEVTQLEEELIKSESPYEVVEISNQSAQEAYLEVLDHVGASLPERDAVDQRIIEEVRTGTATYGVSWPGIIDHPDDVGGYPVLESTPAPTDTDEDGMPDEWEIKAGLNPNDPEDRNEDRNYDGYTNLEEYLNSLVTGYYDIAPHLSILSPSPKAGYLLNDTVFIKAFASDYAGGDIDRFQVLVDHIPAIEMDTTQIDSFLTGLNAGRHNLLFRAFDDSGNVVQDSLYIYVGSTSHNLNANVGTGAGSIISDPEGNQFVVLTELKVHALPQLGYEFDSWSGDIDSTENPISLLVEADINLIANFIPEDTAVLNINFQPKYFPVPLGYIPDFGEKFGLRTNGYFFGWLGDEDLRPRFRENTSDPRIATLIAMQESGNASWELKLPNGNYDLNIHLGDPETNNQDNSINVEGIDLTDGSAGSTYDEYEIENLNISDGALTITPTGENVKINYLKIAASGSTLSNFLTVKNGTGGGEYPAGSNVIIEAAPAPAGLAFDHWTGDAGYITTVRAANTNLLMPDEDVFIRAVYNKPLYTVIVINGTGSGEYNPGELVYLTPDDPGEGQIFSGWIVTDGEQVEIISTISTFAWFNMPWSDLEITAIYENITSTEQLSSEKKIVCYPNPSNGNFYLDLSDMGPSRIKIFNTKGKIVFDITTNENIYEVKKAALEPGIYIMQLTDSDGHHYSEKLMIK